MDISKLRAFCNLIEQGTLAEAAKTAQMSVSGVQRQIVALEKDLNKKLFEKQRRLLKPTLDAEKFYQHCLNILQEYDEAVQELHEKAISSEISGELVINSTHSSVDSWLTEDLAEFINKHQKIQVSMIGDNSPVERLKNECDVFIRLQEGYILGYQQDYLCDFEYALYASEDYVKKNGTPKTVDDLKKHRVIILGRGRNLLYMEINWHYKYLPKGYQDLICVNSGPGALKMIENGLGVGVVSSYAAQQSKTKLVRLLPQESPFMGRVHFVYPESSLKMDRIHLLRRYLIDLYEKRRAEGKAVQTGNTQ